MEQFPVKKTFLILAIVLFTPLVILFVFKIPKEGDIAQQPAAVKQESQMVVEKQETTKSSDEKVAQQPAGDTNEIIGTIVQVDVFDDDNGDLLLTVDADIPDQSKLKDQQISEAADDVELPTITKQFIVLAQKNTPIVGGTLDDLSEDDVVDIVSVENFYDTNKLTAINIEEL
jgi:hypothetical protein